MLFASELQAAIERQEQVMEGMADTLVSVERLACHHAVTGGMTAEQALCAIQHHPGIEAITESYKDGVVPETPNPWADLERHRATAARGLAALRRIWPTPPGDLNQHADEAWRALAEIAGEVP